MLRILSPTSLSTILQSIDMVYEDEVCESSGNGTNLSNLSVSTKSTRAGYLTFEDAKRGDDITKKGVETAKGFDYLTSATKKTFNHLRYAFTQAPILQYFDPKRYTRIETDVSGYAIDGVLRQLTLNDLSQWHPVAYYLQKKVSAKTWYKTHNGELLAIVEAFKTWQHYLKSCKHEVFVLIDHNNLWQFRDTKSLSSC